MVRTSGPIFNGEAARILDRMTEEIADTVAKQGKQDVLQRLGQVLRHPTGRYESRLRVNERGTQATVDDQRSVYGPWLEGTGSRNSSTRFKGYATFRLVRQQLDAKARRIADEVVARTIGRLQ